MLSRPITSSIAGSVIGAGGAVASYAVSKHGVIGLAKQIAVDYGAEIRRPGRAKDE